MQHIQQVMTSLVNTETHVNNLAKWFKLKNVHQEQEFG